MCNMLIFYETTYILLLLYIQRGQQHDSDVHKYYIYKELRKKNCI